MQCDEPKVDIFEALVVNAKNNGLRDVDQRFLNGDAVVGLVAGRYVMSPSPGCFWYIVSDQTIKRPGGISSGVLVLVSS